MIPDASLFHGIICLAEASCKETHPLGENSANRTSDTTSFIVITVLA